MVQKNALLYLLKLVKLKPMDTLIIIILAFFILLIGSILNVKRCGSFKKWREEEKDIMFGIWKKRN